MSTRLPVYFVPTLRLIKTLRGLPSLCRTACGYTATELSAAHNTFFPDETQFTPTTANFYLRKGVASGVFLFGGCRNALSSLPTCNPSNAAARPAADQTFTVNPAMAGFNPANAAYVAVGYVPDPLQKRPGFLPVGECTDSAAPYFASVNRGGPLNASFVGFSNSVSCDVTGGDSCTSVTTVQ